MGAVYGLLVVTPSLAETLPVPAAQPQDKGVQLSSAGPVRGPGALDNGNQRGANRGKSVVELTTPVAAQTQPMPQQQAKKEGQQAQQGGLQEVIQRHDDERTRNNLIMAGAALVLGAAIGGAFGGR